MSKRLIIAAAVTLGVICFLLAAVPAEAARAHTVRQGETLSSIAYRYGVPIEALIHANKLSDPDNLRIGQVLAIPTSAPERPAHKSSVRSPSRGVDHPSPTTTYVVRSGDNLYAIARHFSVTIASLTRANALSSETLQIGQKLQIPSTHSSIARRAQRRPLALPVQPVLRAALESPELATEIVIGAEVKAHRALRMRSGPKTYYPTIGLIAAETQLRILSEESGWYQIQLPNDTVGWIPGEELRSRLTRLEQPVGRADIVADALRYLGTPYRWGGVSSRGVDCSGFVYVVFSRYLSTLGRMSSFDYFSTGVPVDRASLLLGDLVFFTTYAPGPSHVGIYMGDGKFVHASASEGVITSALDDPYYSTHFLGARRLLGP